MRRFKTIGKPSGKQTNTTTFSNRIGLHGKIIAL
ncbi:Uncharacterised protein [Vibrio cholerae]|uniref:Uncharacterized protein n=1 Tax=Vibrio cholerae TaxID=666 RepID=A0A655ZZD5_VIBCL|nr:Uncharacterised protein [Vibrio cholerae]CRZ87620.1 Uncharacterised protein [Vibrio cholerae]CSA00050.1 Uncharacterised protein [Vibrio cholerae]CSA76663.1 Uncharacterised protein [Vibrio cholerae]CSB81650.1 Uncharacterised protein [Vibrio cholerae]